MTPEEMRYLKRHIDTWMFVIAALIAAGFAAVLGSHGLTLETTVFTFGAVAGLSFYVLLTYDNPILTVLRKSGFQHARSQKSMWNDLKSEYFAREHGITRDPQPKHEPGPGPDGEAD